MKKLFFLLILSSLLLIPTIGFSTTVYDNTTYPYGGYLYATGQVGDEVTLIGPERWVTEFMFGYGNLNGSGDETAHIRFYLNDGPGGQPGTLLNDLGVYKLDKVVLGNLTINGLSILIPGDTFTWTVEWGNYGQYYPYFPLYNPPTIGSTKGYIWQGFWGKINEGDSHLKAKIEAESVPIPEPTTILLIGSGLFGLWGFRKRVRK